MCGDLNKVNFLLEEGRVTEQYRLSFLAVFKADSGSWADVDFKLHPKTSMSWPPSPLVAAKEVEAVSLKTQQSFSISSFASCRVECSKDLINILKKAFGIKDLVNCAHC